MAVLVTGGAGYIGSVVVELLRERGFDVRALDDLRRGHRAALAPEVPLAVGDLNDPRFVDSVFDGAGIDSVLHFAAWSQVGESMVDPGLYFRNNVGGILNLLESMRRHEVRRFILSSTAATYGDPQSDLIVEDDPTVPTNPYGESKLLSERILRWYGRLHGLRWIALRYFNAAGATARCGEDHEPETHLIPLALRAALGRSEPLKVFGTDYPTRDGTCVRDYVHVADLAEAHLLALAHLDTVDYGIFNLGNGLGFSVLDVIASVERVSGRTLPWVAADRRAGDPPTLVASSERARRELGWKPGRAEIDVIVGTALTWAESHPLGYADRTTSKRA